MSWSLEEKRHTLTISLLMSMRIFGFLAVLPVMMLSMHQYQHATAATMGLAIGIYGLSQALLQLPMGMLSDRLGRLKIVRIGLVLLASGSLLGAFTHHIYGLIAARALQGCGAVGSTLVAWLCDLTKQDHRPMAMAIMGMGIGLAFMISTALGPALFETVHLQGLMGLTAALAALSWWLADRLPETVEQRVSFQEAQQRQTQLLLQNKSLQFINTSITVLHALYTLTLALLPIWMTPLLASRHHHAAFLYLPALVIAALATLFLLKCFERDRHQAHLIQGGLGAMGCALGLLAIDHTHVASFGVSLTLFFLGFTLLEALLPALASTFAPQAQRGTAMGMFSTAQFMGLFLGGLGSGWLLNHTTPTLLFAGGASTCLTWWYLFLRVYQKNQLEQTASN